MVIGSQTGMLDDGGSAAPVDDKRVIKLEPAEAQGEERRLAYLARLIRRARQPICPVNGILNLIPFGMVQRSSPDAAAVERATRSDMNVLQRALMLRCSVTALVTGIEEESGFRELVRRVGRERALNDRFGKGFSVNNVPLGERLEAWASTPAGPSRTGFITSSARPMPSASRATPSSIPSSARYATACRSGWCESSPAPIPATRTTPPGHPQRADDAFRFTGCYFAGTGESEERQAFVAAVLRKWIDPKENLQEELQWSDTALRQDDRIQLACQLVLVLDLLLLAALAAEVYYVWFWKGGGL